MASGKAKDFFQFYPTPTVCTMARHGKPEDLKKYVAEGHNFNAYDCDGWYPIHHAVDQVNEENCNIILNHPETDRSVLTYLNETILDILCKSKNPLKISLLKTLVTLGCKFSGQEVIYEYAFNVVIEKKNLEAIKILVEHGADLNKCDAVHGSPLHTAVKTKSLEITKYLINAGAKDSSAQDYYGLTALHCLAMGRNADLEICRLLLQLPTCLENIDALDLQMSSTPLGLALNQQNYTLVMELIKAGARIENVSQLNSALYEFCKCTYDEDHDDPDVIACCSLLLEKTDKEYIDVFSRPENEPNCIISSVLAEGKFNLCLHLIKMGYCPVQYLESPMEKKYKRTFEWPKPDYIGILANASGFCYDSVSLELAEKLFKMDIQKCHKQFIIFVSGWNEDQDINVRVKMISLFGKNGYNFYHLEHKEKKHVGVSIRFPGTILQALEFEILDHVLFLLMYVLVWRGEVDIGALFLFIEYVVGSELEESDHWIGLVKLLNVFLPVVSWIKLKNVANRIIPEDDERQKFLDYIENIRTPKCLMHLAALRIRKAVARKSVPLQISIEQLIEETQMSNIHANIIRLNGVLEDHKWEKFDW